MNVRNNSVKFDSLIKDFKLIEENVFVSRISDIASEDKELIISKIQLICGDQKTGIHLKYLIIKVMGNLKFQNFIPLLSNLLNKEKKIRIISEILNSLTNIISLESYKVVVSFFSEQKNKKYLPKFKGYLKIFFGKSPLIYHFDLFYRDRGEVKNIEVSSNFLINNLEETYLKDLLPAIFSKYKTISFETLRLLEKKPGPLFYNSINELFIKKYKDELKYFKQLVRTLFENVAVSPHKKKLFTKLVDQLKLLKNQKRNYFVLFLLKLNTKEIINESILIYKELDIEDRLLFFTNLDPDSYPVYKDFISEKFVEETNEKILLRMILIFIINKEYEIIFKITNAQKGSRREILINLIIEAGKKGLSDFFLRFISVSERNNILLAAIGYIINDSPDAHFEDISKTLFSGVEIRIKQKIIRNIKNFNNSNIRKILKNILDKTVILNRIEKDFLFMLISLQEKDVFNDLLLERLLNYILLMMEEADQEDIINFIYFFDSFLIKNIEHKRLIIDELKMIQQTLLKSSKNDNLVNMIYKLIKKISV